MGFYSGVMARLIIGFKKGRNPSYGGILANIAYERFKWVHQLLCKQQENLYLGASIHTPKLLLTWPPGSSKSYYKRGYDHMKCICRKVKTMLHSRISVQIDCLQLFTRRPGFQQKQLNRSQRLQNAPKIISLKTAAKTEQLQQYDRIIILDDVSTSGATLNVCKQLLTNFCSTPVTTLAIVQD